MPLRGHGRASGQKPGGNLKSATDRDAALYVGLMTGTSLDGVDAVLADLDGFPPRIVGTVHVSLADDLRRELLMLSTSGSDELHRGAVASQHLARGYASAVMQLLLEANVEPAQVRAIGAHGQT